MKIERQTLAQQVLDRLVLRLMESPLKQGQRVSTEQDLMEEFGVSRSSVREAVKALQNLGILESRPALGTFLSAKRDTYSRLLLLSSLLSPDPVPALQQLSHALIFHTLIRLQQDLKKTEDEEIFHRAQQHHLQLETCIANITQQRLADPGSKTLLEQQRELRQLLLSYPRSSGLLARIGCSLEDFLSERQGGEMSFSQDLSARYRDLVAAISLDRQALMGAHDRLFDFHEVEPTTSSRILEKV